MAFSEGVTNKRLVGKLETHDVEMVAELFSLADKCGREHEAQNHTEWWGTPEVPGSMVRNKSGNKKNKRKAVIALSLEGGNKPPMGRNLEVGSTRLPQRTRGLTSGVRFIRRIATISLSADWSTAS